MHLVYLVNLLTKHKDRNTQIHKFWNADLVESTLVGLTLPPNPMTPYGVITVMVSP